VVREKYSLRSYLKRHPLLHLYHLHSQVPRRSDESTDKRI
jgi:hypothetical protein